MASLNSVANKKAYRLLADRIPWYSRSHVQEQVGAHPPGDTYPPGHTHPQKETGTRDTHLPKGYWIGDTPPLHEQTDTCENITYSQLRLRAVQNCCN